MYVSFCFAYMPTELIVPLLGSSTPVVRVNSFFPPGTVKIIGSPVDGHLVVLPSAISTGLVAFIAKTRGV